MRSMLMLMVLVGLGGCSPVPPGDEIGGRATWDLDGFASSGDVYACVAEGDTLLVSSSDAGAGALGPQGTRLAVRVGGPVGVASEWDAEVIDAWHVVPDGTEFGGARLRNLEDCAAHVGTGAGTWVLDLDCPSHGSASIVVTGCERR